MSDGVPLREMIEQSGGIVSIKAIGKRWGCTRARAQVYSQMPGFPATISVDSGDETKLYFWYEVDAWRKQRDAEIDARAKARRRTRDAPTRGELEALR